MLYNLLLGAAVLLAVAIISLVLLQQGRGADTGAAFGGGASGTVFGSRGSATFLSRVTAGAAALFFVNCLALAWLVRAEPETPSLLDAAPPAALEAAPAAPDPTADIPQ